jgi:hypothetical protein
MLSVHAEGRESVRSAEGRKLPKSTKRNGPAVAHSATDAPLSFLFAVTLPHLGLEIKWAGRTGNANSHSARIVISNRGSTFFASGLFSETSNHRHLQRCTNLLLLREKANAH